MSLWNKHEIKICDRHEKQVPLIWTFKFMGAEWWCPACGAIEGMFGAGKDVPVTEELKQLAIEWKEKATPYLKDEVKEWEYEKPD